MVLLDYAWCVCLMRRNVRLIRAGWPSKSSLMKIPLVSLRGQFEPLREQMLTALGGLLDSQQFVLGAEVAALESEIAQYSNTKHAIGCASGSDGLLLALMVLDIKAGHEVIPSPS